MLGHKLYQRISPHFEVFATIRSDFDAVDRFGIFSRRSIISGVDVTEADSVRKVIETVKPECVINAVGLIKQVPASGEVVRTLSVNSIFPHWLAELAVEFGFRLITIGTDCVFSGEKGNYSEEDLPDARDLYGLSKLLGEVEGANSLTIRTSIIGRELSTSHSIVEWFLAQRGQSVRGFTKAIYSGFPTLEMADIIASLITNQPSLTGIYHVSSEPISKYKLLTLLNKYFNAGITIEPSEDVVIDRSLDSTKFRNLTGFEPPRWEQMIERMAADRTPYDTFR